ncbi:3-keto-disaccharide hydrolase [Catalinimonas niigatensis]|uniref:3-keto-disaccharide hydrolase n=1 Tax=Catalinimonas niigatensis TaxID=1397264 RepID=UPI00266516AA|nr:DUF1080 domain-containing protein [Catalinimonas niigatensis]WPP50347.1 DUF1080 domain-containing protein [Catalinimonas niigatensis]
MVTKSSFKIIQWAIVLFTWVMSSCNAQSTNKQQETNPSDEEGFIEIFDGETLEGWEGDPNYWRVENGNLVGEITPDKPLETNSFIIWRGGEPADFELKTEFRISEKGNSGINYRSEQLDTIPYALRGYQADIDGMNRYTGQNYEERKRTTLAYRGQKTAINTQDNPEEAGSLRANVKNNAWSHMEVTESLGDTEALKAKIKSEGWNECHLIIKGNRLQHYINGVLMSDVTDNDTVNRKMSGLLGVQVHVGPPMMVEYRNIRLKEL